MKVLLTADATRGNWTHAMALARAAADIEFIVATMGPLPGERERAEARLPNVRLISSDFKLEWMNDPWEDIERAGDWLLALESGERPDVVHLGGYVHGALPFSAPKIVSARWCVLSWWSAVRREEAPPEWSPYREAVERGLRGSDLVIVPSAWMSRELHRWYRFDVPTVVIHDGFSPNGRVPDFAARSVVLAAGRLSDEAQNLRAVVEAAATIAWPVRIAGDDCLGAPNVECVAGLRAEDAGIYVHPALYEPSGLAVLEAAGAGCALVLGDIPSLREIWNDAAVFVPPRDPGEIAAAVNALVDDSSRRRQLARLALRRAAQYPSERMAGAYRQVCARITRREAMAR